MIKNLKFDKNKIKFTCFYLLFLLFSLFTYFIQNNKINWNEPDKITFNESINLDGSFNTENKGFWYNFATSNDGVNDVKYKYNLFISANYKDINNINRSFDYSFPYEYENQSVLKTDYNIFNSDFNSIDYNKIDSIIRNCIDYKISIGDSDFYQYKNITYPFDNIWLSIGITNYSDIDNSNYNDYYFLDTTLSINTSSSYESLISNISIYYFVPNVSHFQYNEISFNDISSSSGITLNNCALINIQIPLWSINYQPNLIDLTFNNAVSTTELLDKIKSLQQDLYYYQTSYNDIYSQFQELNREYLLLNAQNTNNLREINSLQDQITNLSSQIDSLNNIINQKNSQIEFLTNQLNNARNAEWNFNKLMFTIASTPFESFKTFYNVEFWGINLSDLFLGIVFSGLIFFLFRRFIGSFFSI